MGTQYRLVRIVNMQTHEVQWSVEVKWPLLGSWATMIWPNLSYEEVKRLANEHFNLDTEKMPQVRRELGKPDRPATRPK